ncbi:MAG: hypothetical protein M1818_002961 [Claussenomyces sp. TS43310]|nr:MAG: hypothetical protein M1818_002961 [Claussenomyces sp. TS43310]
MTEDEAPEEDYTSVPYGEFVESILPLYAGPQVSILIGSSSKYRLPKALICKRSCYFRAALEGGFEEGVEQSMTLTEEEGVVSTESFEKLVQWLYLDRVGFNDASPEEEVTATIEFVRLADMCGVTGMEKRMAERIIAIIDAHPDPESGSRQSRHPDFNTHHLTPDHILSVSFLPPKTSRTSYISLCFRRGLPAKPGLQISSLYHDGPQFCL